MFFFTTGTEKHYIMSSEQAFNKYSDMVWRLALSKTASRENADDILQDVFMKYVHKKPKFYDEEHLKAWLLRVTINCSNSFLRSPWEKKTQALDDSFYIEMKETSQVYYEVLKLPEKYCNFFFANFQKTLDKVFCLWYHKQVVRKLRRHGRLV